MVVVPDQALVLVVLVVEREPGLEQALVLEQEQVQVLEKGMDQEREKAQGMAQEKGMAQGMGQEQEPALDCRRHRCGQSEWQHQSPPR